MRKFRVLFIDLTTKLDHFSDLERKGRGGMVSSLYLLPNVLSQIGHDVAVLSDAKEGGFTLAGARWISESNVEEHAAFREWDFIILNRQIYGDAFDEIRAKHRILWVHDMVHGGWIPEVKRARGLSAVVFMSRYSEETWRSYYRDLPRRSFLIPNGVDKNLFHPLGVSPLSEKPLSKDFDRMLFISAPNRGLEHLPIILDTAQQATGRLLQMLAFSKMSALHPQEKEKFEAVYQDVRARGIDLRDPIPQAEVAEWVRSSGLMVKPNDYPETCSNTTLQALAAGVPVVTSPIGADKEWVKSGWNGIITKHSLQDGPLFIMEMCRAVVDILKDRKLHERMIRNAPKTKELFTWEQIGQKWDRMLNMLA